MRNVYGSVRFTLIMILLFPLSALAETKNIVMVDVSGSMAGYGYGSENVVPKVKKQLDDFVAFSSSNEYDTEIIPFASNVYSVSSSKLVIKRGNTNLYKAILYAQEKIQKGRNNIFLITDGAHNMQPSVRDLCAEIEKLKAHKDDSVFYYYVAFSEKAKLSEVACLFDGKDNFVLLDSLYIPQKVSEKAKIQTHPSKKVSMAKTQTSNEESNDGLWLKLLMLLIIVICFVLWWLITFMLSANLSLMRFMAGFQWFGGIVDKSLVKLGSSSEGFKSFMNQSIKDKMQQIQRLSNYIYQLPSKARERVLNQLSPEMKKLVEEVRIKQMGRLPSNDKGTWSGEPGNSILTVYDDYVWTDPKTGETMTVREWRKKYKIPNQIQVEYKNGEPIIDPYSVAKTKVSYKESYNYSDLKDLHNPVNDNLNRELNPSLLNQSATNPARDFVENTANDGSRCPGCRNTYHEKRDGETIIVVPDFIHSICTHNGGRSFAALVQKV